MSATGERAFHVRPEAVDLVLSGLVQHVLVSLPANWVQAAGFRPNVGDRWGPKRLWVGRLRHLRLLLRAEGLRQATVASHVRLRLRQKVQEGANEKVEGGVMTGHEQDLKNCLELMVRLVELDNAKLEKVARAVCILQKAFRRSKRSKLSKRKRKESPEQADAAAMEILEAAFPGVPTKGFVIYLCGSTGIVGDSFRYLRMLAGMGFVVLAPDMMVSAAVRGSTLRTRQPKACMLLDSAASEYWSKASLYAEDSSCAGEMVYSSNADMFLNSPEEFNRMYSNIITLRQAELAHILRSLPSIMRRQGVTLIGSSEGGVVLSCFQDEPFIDIINGRVILAYPCELNYWTYFRPEDAGIVGDPTIPTLNLVGCEDQYFGRTNSVAAKVAQATDLPAVRGHAFETMVERGITHGLVCHFEGAVHTLLRTHDTVVREVLADFLQRPHHTCLKLAVHWERIPHLRSLIRRYRRHHEGNCRVQYVRFCAPRSEQIVGGLDKEEHAELMRRVDRVLYQSGKSKGKTLQGGGTNSDGATPLMERLASVISALHTSSNAPVHTSVSLSQKLPVFVEKVEEQLVGILQEEARSSMPKSPKSPLRQSGYSKLSDAFAPGKENGISPPKKETSPTKERTANAAREVPSSNGGPKPAEASLEAIAPTKENGSSTPKKNVSPTKERTANAAREVPSSNGGPNPAEASSEAIAPAKENGSRTPKKETSPTKERAANAAREVPSSNGGPKPAEASSKTEAHIASDAPSQAPSIGGVRLIQRDLAKGGASKARTREGTARKAVIVDEPLEEQHARLPGPVAQPSPEPLATYGVAGTELATSLIRSAEAVAEAVREHAQCMRQAGFCIGAGALCLCAAVLMVRFYRL